MEPLKEMFNKNFYENLGREFHKADKNFNPEKFTKEVTKNLNSMELNQRMRNTSIVMKNHLPSDYKKTIEIMKKVIPELNTGYTQLLFPDFVSLYGQENFDLSLEALRYFTQFGSSEFAIRVFLKADFDKTIKVMHGWAKDKNHHIRRLSSEGSRPRLPWSFKLDMVIENPKLTLPILEMLKQDEELYVRKSVANHLNDISKEHPKLMLEVIKNWKGTSKHTDWILKHASRTLLKQGDVNVLGHFGIKHNTDVESSGFKLLNNKIKTGEDLNFNFTLKNKGNKKVKIRIEYAVYFKIAGGKLSKKVFKISERELEKHESLDFARKHSFKIISTRKYYPGKQKMALVINGKETAPLEFVLKQISDSK
jgi:3-methyladenine DNA glycosylase AlkC